MHPEIIKVADIEQSIKDVGINYYMDRLIQDLHGNYYYIEAERVTSERDIAKFKRHASIDVYDQSRQYVVETVHFEYDIVRIPNPLAFFCIDAMRLQSEIMNMGSTDYGNGRHGGIVKFYLPKGTEFMGQMVETLTEIPAECRTIEVEEL